jgi:hypothetical protein
VHEKIEAVNHNEQEIRKPIVTNILALNFPKHNNTSSFTNQLLQATPPPHPCSRPENLLAPINSSQRTVPVYIL